MNILIVVSSKSPNPYLYTCIEQLYQIQIRPDSDARHHYKILIVDSDSDDITNYHKVQYVFPEVKIAFVQNRNYEYGAWKYAYEIYPNEDIYFCIQDTNLLHHPIDLSLVQENRAYTFHVDSGFDLEIRDTSRQLLEGSGFRLEYESFFGRNFCIATHSIFIVNNHTIADLLRTLPIPPTTKFGSNSTERIFGMYFILRGIETIDMGKNIRKIHGLRI